MTNEEKFKYFAEREDQKDELSRGLDDMKKREVILAAAIQVAEDAIFIGRHTREGGSIEGLCFLLRQMSFNCSPDRNPRLQEIAKEYLK